MGAPDPENPLFLGFSVLRGGLRPWSQTMVSEGARPWGRGRSETVISDPRNRDHKSLAIANRNFEVASFSRRNRNETAVLQVFSESQ